MYKRILGIILGISLSICGCTELVYAQTSSYAEYKQNTQTSEYSVTPVDEQWKTFSSHQEMLNHIQLSEDYLKNASTEELFDTILNYPLLIDLYFYDDIQKGIEQIAKQFNGLAELLNRTDIGEVLKEKYADTEIPKTEIANYITLSVYNNSIIRDKNTRKKVYTDLQNHMKIYFEEALFFEKNISKQYSPKEQTEILNEVIVKMKERAKSPIYYYQATSNFVQFASKSSDNIIWKNIIDSSQTTINNNTDSTITISSKSSGNSSVYVKTPNGTKIKCIIKSNNKQNSSNFVKQQKVAYPNATVVGNGYTGNNCHAYAWTGRQDIWMNSPSAYVSDRSYKKISSGHPTSNGQKAVWGSYVHSAIVMNYSKQDPIVTSKWGGGCIMRCTASYCPYSGKITYYKRNK